jgi:hypothetical protein
VALRYDLQAAQTLHAMGRLSFDVWDKGNQLLAEMKADLARGGTKTGKNVLRGKKR